MLNPSSMDVIPVEDFSHPRNLNSMAPVGVLKSRNLRVLDWTKREGRLLKEDMSWVIQRRQQVKCPLSCSLLENENPHGDKLSFAEVLARYLLELDGIPRKANDWCTARYKAEATVEALSADLASRRQLVSTSGAQLQLERHRRPRNFLHSLILCSRTRMGF